jgi:hypothetical protein
MHNLVLELDNNLSFGDHSKEDKEEPQLSKNEIDEKLTNLMSESCLKSVQVDPQLFSLEDSAIIGKGTFSSVYKCQLYGMDVAVKVFECRMSSSGNQEVYPSLFILSWSLISRPKLFRISETDQEMES